MKSLLGKLGIILIGLAIFGFFLVSLASADVTLKTYKSTKDTETFKSYIAGVGNGFGWANTFLGTKGEPPLYCQPNKLSMTAENYLQILQKFIQENKELTDKLGPDCFVEMLLLQGLIETFPCK